LEKAFTRQVKLSTRRHFVQLSARRHAIRMTAQSDTIRTGAAADYEELHLGHSKHLSECEGESISEEMTQRFSAA